MQCFKSSAFRKVFFCGIFMGIADLIPGISGGTVAFISGIYERLLENLRKINFQFFRKKNFKTLDLRFLVTLFSGIGISFFCFSFLLRVFFSNPFLKGSLYTFFFGVILGSVFFSLKK